MLEEVHVSAYKKSILGSEAMAIDMPLHLTESGGQWGRFSFKLFVPGLQVSWEFFVSLYGIRGYYYYI